MSVTWPSNIPVPAPATRSYQHGWVHRWLGIQKRPWGNNPVAIPLESFRIKVLRVWIGATRKTRDDVFNPTSPSTERLARSVKPGLGAQHCFFQFLAKPWFQLQHLAEIEAVSGRGFPSPEIWFGVGVSAVFRDWAVRGLDT